MIDDLMSTEVFFKASGEERDTEYRKALDKLANVQTKAEEYIKELEEQREAYFKENFPVMVGYLNNQIYSVKELIRRINKS